MKCPRCGCEKSKVIKTDKLGRFIQRTRECASCKMIFKTEEWITASYEIKYVREIKEK